MAFVAPGLTMTEMELLIADATNLDVAVPVELTQIDQAITAAGEAACTMDGTDWWFLWDTGTFDTEKDVAGYDLRAVNSKAMENLYAPRQVWWSTMRLGVIDYQQYLNLIRPQSTVAPGNSTMYALGPNALTANMTMYLYATPGSIETVTIDYLRRHGKLTNAAGDIVIPAEFHEAIYVAGALWLLRHNIADIANLRNCPEFMAGIYAMRAAAPTEYDDTASPGGQLPIPDGEHVIIIRDT